MVWMVAFLVSLSISLSLWFVADGYAEERLMKERVAHLRSAHVSGGASRQSTSLLKSQFALRKSPLRKIIELPYRPSPVQAAVFAGIWAGASYLILSRFPAALSTQVVLIVLTTFVMLRYFRGVLLSSRKKKILTELPGTLDLLVICIEAGLSMNAAFLRVSNDMKNSPLGDELRQTFQEISAGIPMEQALRNFSKRAGVEDIKSIVATLIQAQKMGTALGPTFRIQADSIREKTKMRMKEQMMKVPVKILFPLVFFIFPAIFLVILGPAMISIMEQFGGGTLGG